MKKKYPGPKEYEEIRKKEAARVREYRLKKMSEKVQVSTATSASEITPTMSSAFSKKNPQILSRSVHKTERSLQSNPRKKAEVIGTLTKNKLFTCSCT